MDQIVNAFRDYEENVKKIKGLKKKGKTQDHLKEVKHFLDEVKKLENHILLNNWKPTQFNTAIEHAENQRQLGLFCNQIKENISKGIYPKNSDFENKAFIKNIPDFDQLNQTIEHDAFYHVKES